MTIPGEMAQGVAPAKFSVTNYVTLFVETIAFLDVTAKRECTGRDPTDKEFVIRLRLVTSAVLCTVLFSITFSFGGPRHA